MTADEIRATCASDEDFAWWLKEIALQLALLNEKAERIDALLEVAQARPCPKCCGGRIKMGEEEGENRVCDLCGGEGHLRGFEENALAELNAKAERIATALEAGRTCPDCQGCGRLVGEPEWHDCERCQGRGTL